LKATRTPINVAPAMRAGGGVQGASSMISSTVLKRRRLLPVVTVADPRPVLPRIGQAAFWCGAGRYFAAGLHRFSLRRGENVDDRYCLVILTLVTGVAETAPVKQDGRSIKLTTSGGQAFQPLCSSFCRRGQAALARAAGRAKPASTDSP